MKPFWNVFNGGRALNAVHYSSLSTNEKHFLLYLGSQMDFNSDFAEERFESIDTIASAMSASRRTVQYISKSLLDKGYIVKKARFKNNRQTTNSVALTPKIFEEYQCYLEEKSKEKERKKSLPKVSKEKKLPENSSQIQNEVQKDIPNNSSELNMGCKSCTVSDRGAESARRGVQNLHGGGAESAHRTPSPNSPSETPSNKYGEEFSSPPSPKGLKSKSRRIIAMAVDNGSNFIKRETIEGIADTALEEFGFDMIKHFQNKILKDEMCGSVSAKNILSWMKNEKYKQTNGLEHYHG